ncbi:MAG: hypothetical protein AAF670_00310 [Planctomycetota bacterium]
MSTLTIFWKLEPTATLEAMMTNRSLFTVVAMVWATVGGACADHSAAQSPEKFEIEVSYTNDIQPIVNNFCATCHAGGDPQGDLVLTSYEDVRRHTQEGDLLNRINDVNDPMPQNGLMPASMRRLFETWALQGYIDRGKPIATAEQQQMREFTPPKIVPVDVRNQGFEMLESLQGHWVGSMNLMGQELDWMAFDFRPVAPSHVHAIFEGGTIGNLFTSFFVAKFRGKQTIMARNGGILNGIYRTSYFVLDTVRYGRDWAYYRLVDAHGGQQVMFMEMTFRGDTLDFNAFTSRFGLTTPRPHMAFRGRRMHPELAMSAAKAVDFPRNVIDYEFPSTLPKPTWSDEYPLTSASYVWERDADDTSPSRAAVAELGKLARDPRRIDQMPYLSELTVSVRRDSVTQGKKLHVYLSRDALVDQRGHFLTRFGYIREERLNTLLSFPELSKNANEFTFTYLHPGDYYLTVIADMDDDGLPSPGDVTHSRRRVKVDPESHPRIEIIDLNVRN